MAQSTMAVDVTKTVPLVKDTINSVDVLNTTVVEIVTKFNAMLETATGHDHDGTNSRLANSAGGLSTEDMLLAAGMGFFDGGGF